ncbi:piggyBac transposable element-derived protein 4-like [Oncorhynchus tshawytscha]|uniref:piggyBac transposable element-derived protein 4-like n=1 Tax=Oncorhynchus tshawytscha TaxID=74940 RepID=UPI001C3CA43D|nr:piggyBac transposable element-derived protein 4-like [Oncorhynchus tshawytscha]
MRGVRVRGDDHAGSSSRQGTHFVRGQLVQQSHALGKAPSGIRRYFFHLIDIAVLNGSIVHRQLTGKVITYQKYRENLMRELLEEHHTPRRPSTGGLPAVDNPLRLTARHFPCKVPQTASQGSRTRRHCKVCLSGARRSKQRKMTKYMCLACDTPLMYFTML